MAFSRRAGYSRRTTSGRSRGGGYSRSRAPVRRTARRTSGRRAAGGRQQTVRLVIQQAPAPRELPPEYFGLKPTTKPGNKSRL